MTASATNETASAATGRDIRLSITAPGGIPLTMAGYLLRAIGSAYPGTAIEDGQFGTVLALRVPYGDYVTSDGISEDDLAALAPDKDDPGLVAFTHGFRDGGLGVTPPLWLSAMLTEVAESLTPMLDDAGASNYLSMELLPQDGGEPFVWIVCRRGAPSPHELRTRAEKRADDLERHVERLERQLRDAGIEPCTGTGDAAGG